jgi:hypothetical protein
MDATAPAPVRKVGFWLAVGIIFLPWIFSWFTLRKGHSTLSRVLAMAWVGVVIIGMARHKTIKDVPVEASPRPVATIQRAIDRPAPPPEQAIRLSAIELWDVYHANEVAADNQYKDRLLLVDGTVKSIDKDFMDNIVLHLRSRNEFMGTMAKVEDSEKSRAAALRKGQKVALECRGDGMVMGSPSLRSCVFQ